MKILKVFTDWNRNKKRKDDNSGGGCWYYRTKKVSENLREEHEVIDFGNQWKEKSDELGTNEKFFEWMFEEHDIIWSHYIDNDRAFAWLRAAATMYKKKLVIDIDDNFLDIDPSNPALKQLDNKRRAFMSVILLEADAVTVSTEPLKKAFNDHFMKIHGKTVPIFVIPNCNDLEDWKHPKVPQNGTVIGYMGSTSHADDLLMVLPSIKKILEKYPKVGFQLMGQVNLEESKKLFGTWSVKLRKRIFLIQPTHTFDEFPKLMLNQPWTIGIAPLIGSKFNEGKSHIKWMEYAMCGIPTLASDVYPYNEKVAGRDTIIDGKTGMLCGDKEWVDKLSLLIEDEDLRDTLAENAYDYIKDNWQYKHFKKEMLDVVKKIQAL